MLCRENLKRAYNRVRSNKGAPGIDGMTVNDLGPYLKEHRPRRKEEIRNGTYQPRPVRRVDIPKPGGKGTRMPGIPTVLDRFIRQAIQQVLTPIFDPHMSTSSYGFRPGRSAHDAVRQARQCVEDGYRCVVDIDLEKFFDTVNHDMLMARVTGRVKDKRLLDDPDKELERREHRFCRYADDCNVYVKSTKAGERVMASLTRFLEKKLRLKVKGKKSAVAAPWIRKFLGYPMTRQKIPGLKVAPEPVRRLKGQIKEVLRKGRGRAISRVITEMTPLLSGWMEYFLASVKVTFGGYGGSCVVCCGGNGRPPAPVRSG